MAIKTGSSITLKEKRKRSTRLCQVAKQLSSTGQGVPRDGVEIRDIGGMSRHWPTYLGFASVLESRRFFQPQARDARTTADMPRTSSQDATPPSPRAAPGWTDLADRDGTRKLRWRKQRMEKNKNKNKKQPSPSPSPSPCCPHLVVGKRLPAPALYWHTPSWLCPVQPRGEATNSARAICVYVKAAALDGIVYFIIFFSWAGVAFIACRGTL
ncbi:hypothetical protein LX32DRAFT_315548 [Colletotrichum zoysiae]|uniref:Uncharacterized protein n=1 Tax=Colletotrichum zoysiae TaxID=1216348 RepID=A0AAD9H1W3_9PEZI|nr:hypothetical protein LX32DRAFT_315548 [Colletotrichum zoysiae]